MPFRGITLSRDHAPTAYKAQSPGELAFMPSFWVQHNEAPDSENLPAQGRAGSRQRRPRMPRFALEASALEAAAEGRLPACWCGAGGETPRLSDSATGDIAPLEIPKPGAAIPHQSSYRTSGLLVPPYFGLDGIPTARAAAILNSPILAWSTIDKYTIHRVS